MKAKRILAYLLALLLCVSMLPGAALADGEEALVTDGAGATTISSSTTCVLCL